MGSQATGRVRNKTCEGIITSCEKYFEGQVSGCQENVKQAHLIGSGVLMEGSSLHIGGFYSHFTEEETGV